jgi:hypothetical protein
VGQYEGSTVPTTNEVIGMTEAPLRVRYPELAELNNSFCLLVSKKSLHPYHPPGADPTATSADSHQRSIATSGGSIGTHCTLHDQSLRRITYSPRHDFH